MITSSPFYYQVFSSFGRLWLVTRNAALITFVFGGMFNKTVIASRDVENQLFFFKRYLGRKFIRRWCSMSKSTSVAMNDEWWISRTFSFILSRNTRFYLLLQRKCEEISFSTISPLHSSTLVLIRDCNSPQWHQEWTWRRIRSS